jgi:Spy/CpxP family protein refolding chaperone
MLSKKLLIPLAVVLFFALPAFADSNDQTARDQKMHGADILTLTKDQKIELRELRKIQQEVLRNNLLPLRAASVRLRIAFQSSNSEEQIRTQAAALSALKAQIDAARLDHQIAVWKILTPDQRLLMPQQGHRSALAPGYQRHKGKGHGGFWDRKWRKGWDNKHSMNGKNLSAGKWRKSRQNSDSRKEY